MYHMAAIDIIPCKWHVMSKARKPVRACLECIRRLHLQILGLIWHDHGDDISHGDEEQARHRGQYTSLRVLFAPDSGTDNKRSTGGAGQRCHIAG